MDTTPPDGPYCKSCLTAIEGTEESCPHCGFHPRNSGLRYTGGLMIAVAVLFSVVTLTGGTWPHLAGYVFLAMLIAFGLAVISFIIAFMATPYRFGGLFA